MKTILFKAISWRVCGTLATVGVALTVTGSTAAALSIGLGDTLIKLLAYMAHEFAWEKAKR